MEQDDTIFQSIRDKKILVLGELDKRKQYVFDIARKNGIKLIYADTCKDAYGRDEVAHFIHLELINKTDYDLNADVIIALLKADGIILDGCVTFKNDYMVLAALISSKLGLNGTSLQGARIAYSKHKIHAHLNQFPETRGISSQTHRIRTKEDLSSAVQSIPLPAILKIEYGSGGCGVSKVHTFEDCLNVFKNIQQINNSSIRNDLSIKYAVRHGVSLVLMDYIRGTEHDINVIMYNGNLIGAFVSDNGPTRENCYFETATTIPSCLPREQHDNLIETAHLCCVKLGLLNGVFNVEMKMTKNGPKLLEINTRMPGFFIRNWILELYGVDLAQCVFLLSAGIKPDIPDTLTPKGQIMGIMCMVSIHSKTLQQPHIKMRLDTLRSDKEIIYVEMTKEEEWNSFTPDLDWFCCNIAVKECDVETAKTKLLNICNGLGINKPEYQVEYFLQDFHASD